MQNLAKLNGSSRTGAATTWVTGSRVSTVVVALLATLALTVLGSMPAFGTGSGHPSRVHSGTIKGSVRGVNDEPADALHGPLGGAEVTVVDADRGGVVASGVTGADGTFLITSVPPGRVKVRIAKPGYLDVWSDNAPSSAAATVYRLHRQRTLTLPDPQVLYAEAVISGQLLEGFDPPGDPARIEVFDARTHRVLGSVLVPAGEGDYRIGGLPAVPIKVRARALSGMWADSWADGAYSCDMATVFSLRPGQHLSQTWSPAMSLYLDLTYAGEVTGTVLGHGKPLLDSTVTVYDLSGAVVGRGRSDAAGRYRVRVSLALTQQVKVKAAKTGWQPTYANGKDNFATADVIALGWMDSVGLPPLILTRGPGHWRPGE